MTANDISAKIEQILADDRNFSTRTGLRFTLELVKDAFDYIDGEKNSKVETDKELDDLSDRIGNVETQITGFLNARKEEQKKAEDERTWYRRTVIGGIIVILLGQIAQLIFH